MQLRLRLSLSLSLSLIGEHGHTLLLLPFWSWSLLTQAAPACVKRDLLESVTLPLARAVYGGCFGAW